MEEKLQEIVHNAITSAVDGLRKENQLEFQRLNAKIDRQNEMRDRQLEVRDMRIEDQFIAIHRRFDELARENEARDKGIKREFRNVYEQMDDGFRLVNTRMDQRFALVEERLDRHDVEFEKVAKREDMNKRFEVVDKRLDNMDKRFDSMDERFDSMDERFENLETNVAKLDAVTTNYRVLHLGHKVVPLPVRNSSKELIPTPICFPSTAYRLYRLQDRQNWWKLKTLILHYSLEKATIQLVQRGELYDSDSESESESRMKYNEADLDHAIETSPFVVMSSLSRHIGVDIDSLHDRVTQIEFQQKKGTVAKRPAEDAGGPRKSIRELVIEAAQRGSFTREEPFESEDSGKYTKLNWECDSEKFRRETAHLVLRDTEPTLPWAARTIAEGQEQRSLEIRSRHSQATPSPTEKMTSSSDKSKQSPR